MAQLTAAATRQGPSKMHCYVRQVWGPGLVRPALGRRQLYLEAVRRRRQLDALAQLRSGSHWGAEETGRWAFHHNLLAHPRRRCPHGSAACHRASHATYARIWEVSTLLSTYTQSTSPPATSSRPNADCSGKRARRVPRTSKYASLQPNTFLQSAAGASEAPKCSRYSCTAARACAQQSRCRPPRALFPAVSERTYPKCF
jgi:hypothetical protein